jgi:hypothetical protein
MEFCYNSIISISISICSFTTYRNLHNTVHEKPETGHAKARNANHSKAFQEGGSRLTEAKTIPTLGKQSH